MLKLCDKLSPIADVTPDQHTAQEYLHPWKADPDSDSIQQTLHAVEGLPFSVVTIVPRTPQ